jgi:hypothetical protein
MKATRLSVAAIGFAILVIAIDFAVIRAAFLSPGSKGWGDLPECAIADSCHGMGLRDYLRGAHPDRVLLHPASAGRCHRGAACPELLAEPADHGSGSGGNNAGRRNAQHGP